MPRRPLPAADLTVPAGALHGLNGRPIVDVTRATLDAGASLVQAWRDLEPIVRQLTKKVQAYVDADDFDGVEGARLLSLSATVVQKVGAAAQGMLRTMDGLSRLTLVLEGGVTRPTPRQMTEKQLATVVLEAAKKLAADAGSCPVCTKTVEVQPA